MKNIGVETKVLAEKLLEIQDATIGSLKRNHFFFTQPALSNAVIQNVCIPLTIEEEGKRSCQQELLGSRARLALCGAVAPN